MNYDSNVAINYIVDYTRTNEIDRHDYHIGLLVEAERLSHEAQLICDEIYKQLTDTR